VKYCCLADGGGVPWPIGAPPKSGAGLDHILLKLVGWINGPCSLASLMLSANG